MYEYVDLFQNHPDYENLKEAQSKAQKVSNRWNRGIISL